MSESGSSGSLRRAGSSWVDSSLLESSRAESGWVERFAGRLRAFDPKCMMGAREVEETEETQRRKEEVALLRGFANWVRCARIVVRRSLSGRKPNIAGIWERDALRAKRSSNGRFGVTCSFVQWFVVALRSYRRYRRISPPRHMENRFFFGYCTKNSIADGYRTIERLNGTEYLYFHLSNIYRYCNYKHMFMYMVKHVTLAVLWKKKENNNILNFETIWENQKFSILIYIAFICERIWVLKS